MSSYQPQTYLPISKWQTDESKKEEVRRRHIRALPSNRKFFYLLLPHSSLFHCFIPSDRTFWGWRVVGADLSNNNPSEKRGRDSKEQTERKKEREREFRDGWEPSLSQFRGSLVDSLEVLVSLWKWSCSEADVHRNLPYSPGVVVWIVTGCMGQWGQWGSKHEGSTLKFVCPVVAVDGKVRFSTTPPTYQPTLSLPPLCHTSLSRI